MQTAHALTRVLIALMIVQSVLGLLFQGEYRDVAWIKATWFGNDWVTLLAAVPLLVFGLGFARRSSVAGLLAWLGLVGYAFYNYAYYLFGAALNSFFPIYVAALVLAASILILALSRVDVRSAAGAFRDSTPVRIIGGYFALVAIGLASVWIGTWAAYIFAGHPTPIAPEAFRLVAAVDLSVMVTALALGGVLLWRRRPWGYVVAAVAGIQGSLYLVVLSVNSIVMIDRGLADGLGELPLWGTLAVCTAAATLVLLGHIRRDALVGEAPPC